MTEAARRVYSIAARLSGRYLLPRVHAGTSDSLACAELVTSGHAHWMVGLLAPGIRLTGKPLPRAPSPPTPP